MIYFDNAGTTKCSQKAIEIVKKYLEDVYFNPSAMYHDAIQAKNDLNSARADILKTLHAPDGKLVFTSGGTESDNLACFGKKFPTNSRIIVSNAEHSAIYQCALELKQRGYDVVFAPVDIAGRVIVEEYEKLLTPNTSFVSIIHVNNETGAINDIKTLCALAKKTNKRVLFHSDGVQAYGKININLISLGVDMYSISAHKIGAPKGVGALYIKKGLMLAPIILGGGQEGGLRSSTENVGGIIALAEQGKTYNANLTENRDKILLIRNEIANYLANFPEIIILESVDNTHNILTFTSDRVRGEVMQHALERRGILIGTGSACSSNKASRRIAEALNLKGKYIDGIMRLSFSPENVIEDAREFIRTFDEIYKDLKQYGS